jgi:hypothetical protein
MKKYIIILSLLPLTSFAKPEKITNEMLCDDTKKIVEFLAGKEQQFPMLVGLADDVANSQMTLWVNPKTKEWTITATKDDITCFVGSGKNLAPFKMPDDTKPKQDNETKPYPFQKKNKETL